MYYVQIVGIIIILQRKAKVFLPAFRDRHRYYFTTALLQRQPTTLQAKHTVLATVGTSTYSMLLPLTTNKNGY